MKLDFFFAMQHARRLSISTKFSSYNVSHITTDIIGTPMPALNFSQILKVGKENPVNPSINLLPTLAR
jgi:hypothetical protein